MDDASVLDAALQKRASAIAYGISRALTEMRQGKAVLEARNDCFNVQEYADSGHCTATAKPGIHSQIETSWTGPGEGTFRRDCTAWYAVTWESHVIEVVTASWQDFLRQVRFQWIIAENSEVATAFFEAVCEWCHETRGEVLVFSEGSWQKSADLFRAIRATGFDSLVLQGAMKDELRQDFDNFLGSRQMYEQYGVPWKRGALFLGPPGNGKTHCVKALVNALQIPCLYVQSFKACYCDEQASIKSVFNRARKTVPCLLVLEDVESLVTADSRVFLLNELDGFAENAGLITLATSNHPEQLDLSILERPSRFDRKYYFGLPGPTERLAYLSLWDNKFPTEMRLASKEITELVALTEGFSFAYLKELVLSSSMIWMCRRIASKLPATMREQAGKLREQMGRGDGQPAAQ